jgi:hypothetical protein
LNGNRNTPGCVIRTVPGRIVNDGSEQETDGDSPLVTRNDGTTNPFGRAGIRVSILVLLEHALNLPFGLIHRDQARNHTDTKTGKYTTD